MENTIIDQDIDGGCVCECWGEFEIKNIELYPDNLMGNEQQNITDVEKAALNLRYFGNIINKTPTVIDNITYYDIETIEYLSRNIEW